MLRSQEPKANAVMHKLLWIVALIGIALMALGAGVGQDTPAAPVVVAQSGDISSALLKLADLGGAVLIAVVFGSIVCRKLDNLVDKFTELITDMRERPCIRRRPND